MRHVVLIAAMASALLCPIKAQADEICDQLQSFESASFDRSVEPSGRRWFEMRWKGQWLGDGWGLECSRSGGGVAPDLCQWLVENSSFESPYALPMRILECHGHRFPDQVDWSDWSAVVGWYEGERESLLEINLLRSDEHSPAIRYSIFDFERDETLAEMPPI